MSEKRVRVAAWHDLPPTFPQDSLAGRIDLAIAHTADELRARVRRAEVLYSWRIFLR
jgi:hypothetical protein